MEVRVAKSYRSQYLDPRWQKKRLKVMESTGFKCESCQSETNTLNVHHKQYIPNRDVWDYENEQLAVLCQSCHEYMHLQKDLLNEVISRFDVDPQFRIAAAYLLAGFYQIDIEIDENASYQRFAHSIGECAGMAFNAGFVLADDLERRKK
jgi:hypothetical protein